MNNMRQIRIAFKQMLDLEKEGEWHSGAKIAIAMLDAFSFLGTVQRKAIQVGMGEVSETEFQQYAIEQAKIFVREYI